MGKKLFKRYYNRLAFHGIIKALFLGLIVGFIGLLISSLCCWFCSYKALWLCLTIFGALVIASTPIFYFVYYRPNTKEIATRIDECGLEERMITMTELDGDDSFIARMQREDAIKALNTVDAKLLKFIVSIPVLIVLGCSCVLGVSAAVVEGLYQGDVLKPGVDVVKPGQEMEYYSIEYDVQGYGTIDGELFQVVEAGKDSELVIAVADEDFVFSKWIDADGNDVSDNPARIEAKVDSDIYLIAVFEKPEYNDKSSGGDENDNDDGDNGDDAGDGDAKGKPSEGQGNSKDSNSSDEKPSESKKTDGSSAGSNYRDNEKILDGDTSYKDSYDDARDEVFNEITDNKTISGDNRDITSGYFDLLN